MVLVMAVSMLAGSRLAMLAGAGALVAVALVCAVLSRRAGHFAAQCVDLWAMALGMLALTISPVAGHHGAGAPGMVLYFVVLAAWGAARVALARAARLRGQPAVAVARTPSWRADAASAALAGAGLALMLALH
jgi:hypothetical protein